jgi:hypothetical protein
MNRHPDPRVATQFGLAVFPLPAGGKVCRPGWHSTVLADRGQLRRGGWPAGANVGVGCRASRVVVLDLDRHDSGANAGVDGLAVFHGLCQRWGQPWPDTLQVTTPHGGLHLYLRPPVGVVVPSSSGGRSRLGPGIDVRSPGVRLGGYVVGPDSVVDGGRYRVVRAKPIAPMPGWLAALLRERPPGRP